MKNKKLIKVSREIEVVNKKDNEEIQTVNIDHIPLEPLLLIFTPYERGDPLLYDPYDSSEEQLQKLNSFLVSTIVYDDNLGYILACFGICEDII